MDSEHPTNPEPSAVPETEHSYAHTYQDDMNKAMQATDPASVQKMMEDARVQQAEAEEIKTEQSERKWYSISGLFLIILTVAVVGFGAYYYMHLTVKVVPTASVGAFQSTENIVASTTSIQSVLATLAASTTLPVGKPELVNLVTDAQTNTLLSNSQLYSFIGAQVPGPLQGVITVARLGIVNTGQGVIPFIVASVSDPDKSSKEFTIAEPGLLQLFYQALGIDISGISLSAIPAFQSQYFYNLPVRTLSVTDSTGQQSMIMLYGYASNNIVVITPKPEALKAVYDSIINQN
jgi:hypothetical protein